VRISPVQRKFNALAGDDKPFPAARYAGRPVIACEYAHAMENSSGNAADHVGSPLGRWSRTVEEFPHPYAHPQENGNRTGLQRLTLTGGELSATGPATLSLDVAHRATCGCIRRPASPVDEPGTAPG
jgi:hypothetical protein